MMAAFTPGFLQNSGGAMLVVEMSTPFMRGRLLIHEHKLKDTW